MAGIKGDMAGGAAVAAAVRAIAAAGIPVNVTAVVPCCENRISTTSLLPGDLIGSLSGKTIEVFNADAEGRLILADGLTWAIRKEGCTRLVDAATLTGAICAMLGYVATGVMASDDGWYAALERPPPTPASASGVCRTSRNMKSSSAATSVTCATRAATAAARSRAGLFLRHFTEGLPWLHLDIAGTADNKGYVWEHQVPGATGTAVSTLFHLACGLAGKKGGSKMKRPLIEACVDSYASAMAASRAGADRLELCAHLVIGGTTPTPCSVPAGAARQRRAH